MSAVVASKPEMYKLYAAGAFGGGTKHWYGLGAIAADPPAERVVFRYATPGASWPRAGQVVEPSDVESLCAEWVGLGADPDLITLGAYTEGGQTVQGEVMRSPEYLSFRFTEARDAMRAAFKVDERHCSGLEAVLRIRAAMDGPSWEWLWHLLDTYDGAVVEFSCFDRVMTEDGRNTIFWEVRHY